MKSTLIGLGLLFSLLGLSGFNSAQTAAKRPAPSLSNEDIALSDQSAGGQFIRWQRSLANAFLAAKGDEKLVVVDVYTDWCGWCRKMDENVYTHPSVVALSQREVFVKLNAEDGAEGQAVAERYGVQGYPTTLVFDHEGDLVGRKTGYIATPQGFLNYIENIRQLGSRRNSRPPLRRPGER